MSEECSCALTCDAAACHVWDGTAQIPEPYSKKASHLNRFYIRCSNVVYTLYSCCSRSSTHSIYHYIGSSSAAATIEQRRIERVHNSAEIFLNLKKKRKRETDGRTCDSYTTHILGIPFSPRYGHGMRPMDDGGTRESYTEEYLEYTSE